MAACALTACPKGPHALQKLIDESQKLGMKSKHGGGVVVVVQGPVALVEWASCGLPFLGSADALWVTFAPEEGRVGGDRRRGGI
jgi:hypothetical protein